MNVYGNVDPVLAYVATVSARWRLRKAAEVVEGATTLTFEHSPELGWRITVDHSS